MSISLRDYELMTLPEFNAVAKSWSALKKRDDQNNWERTRTMITMLLTPHAKKGQALDPKKILPLPWDNEFEVKEGAPQITDREAAYQRFLKLTKNG